MPSPPPSRSEPDWSASIAAANLGGDYLQAIDLSSRALAEHPGSLPLAYARLLGFARVGATRRAEIELERLDGERKLSTIADPRLRVDFLALRGRLLKDRAIRAHEPGERALLAARAAEVYADVFAQWGGCFAAVNAATLWRVAGDPAKAATMARRALDAAPGETDEYWRLASEAEAWIHLGDEVAAANALRAAGRIARGRLDALASTRRQLDWLARVAGVGGAALAAAPAPRVLHWIASSGGNGTVATGYLGLIAFGSLFSGADIAMAESLRREGAELNFALPCAAELCRAFLVEREGEAVGPRFDALVAAARNVTVVTPEGDPGEPTVARLAIEQARGQALIRAAALATTVEISGDYLAGSDGGAASASIWSRRRARALVFGDIKGFSTISEARHPAFFETVLGGFADALALLGPKIEYAETAGDGIYVVLSDVVAAVAACHALQRSVDPERFAAAGLPRELGLRLSAHLGPVFPGLDRVTGREKFFGKEVVRTARIEPVTPVGETYVTEQFASQLAFAAGDRYSCEYVGRQAMAKGFGECRMYSLREVAASG
jgi:tetratricopeptide (TPR) repeat protein